MRTSCAATLIIVVRHMHRRDEADEFVEIGALNGIFVLGRSMGFIGKQFQCTPCTYTVWHTPLPCVTLHFDLSRSLPGPEEAEAGSVSPPMG